MIDCRPITPEQRTACLPWMLDLIEAERRAADSRIYFGPPATNAPFLARFCRPDGVTLGAFHGERMLGFSLLGLAPMVRDIWQPHIAALGARREACGVLFGTFVDAAHRGCGIGTALHRRRAAEARQSGVWHLFSLVHPENRASLRLLENHDFAVIGHLESYKDSGPRALMHGPSQVARAKSSPGV